MNKKGFTLVELAIVLVIIGLLVGGVLQGQELIKQAQVRNVITRLNQFDAAVNTFKAKYDQLPGDFSRASAFLVDSANASATKNVAATTGSALGDGDNSGVLADGLGTTSTIIYSGEIANFWVHLSNAGLVKGSYAQPGAYGCTTAGASCNHSIATNAYPDLPVGTGVVALSQGNRMFYVLGVAASITTNFQTAGELVGNKLTPEEAYSIDAKLDNGTGTTGAVQVIAGYSIAGVFDVATAVAGCHSAAGVYVVSTTTGQCTIRARVAG